MYYELSEGATNASEIHEAQTSKGLSPSILKE